MLNLQQKQSLQQKLSPQQIQYIKLLQLPTLALEQRIKAELETNPVLEEGEDEELEEVLDEDEQAEAESTDQEVQEAADKADDSNSDDDYDWEEFLNSSDDLYGYKARVDSSDGEDDREIPMPSRTTMVACSRVRPGLTTTRAPTRASASTAAPAP